MCAKKRFTDVSHFRGHIFFFFASYLNISGRWSHSHKWCTLRKNHTCFKYFTNGSDVPVFKNRAIRRIENVLVGFLRKWLDRYIRVKTEGGYFVSKFENQKKKTAPRSFKFDPSSSRQTPARISCKNCKILTIYPPPPIPHALIYDVAVYLA